MSERGWPEELASLERMLREHARPAASGALRERVLASVERARARERNGFILAAAATLLFALGLQRVGPERGTRLQSQAVRLDPALVEALELDRDEVRRAELVLRLACVPCIAPAIGRADASRRFDGEH